mmetsp:Transcript_15476/g.23038  ORF Transcript_15476/g.23038 Transcript_15476/m.23038 type:complete len:376 (-) Transcript_15476:131-1258(-)
MSHILLTTGLFTEINQNLNPDHSPKLNVKGAVVDDLGIVNLESVQISLMTARSHEKFIPRYLNKDVVLVNKTLRDVNESWKDFLRGSSSAFESYLETKNGKCTISPLTFFYNKFYAKLFEICPSMRKLFNHNMIAESRFLADLTCECAGLYEVFSVNGGLYCIENLVEMYSKMGVRSEHYGPFSSALLYALSACLSPEKWQETRFAWFNVVSFVVRASISWTIIKLKDRDGKETEMLQWFKFQNFLYQNKIRENQANFGNFKRSLSDSSTATGLSPFRTIKSRTNRPFDLDCSGSSTLSFEDIAQRKRSKSLPLFSPGALAEVNDKPKGFHLKRLFSNAWVLFSKKPRGKSGRDVFHKTNNLGKSKRKLTVCNLN